MTQQECARRWYLKNRKRHIANVKANSARLKEIKKRIVWEYKLSHPCVDCGETDPIVLEFDHRHRPQKSQDVSLIVTRKTVGLDKLYAEMAICDVRCANCHRRKTWYERIHEKYILGQQHDGRAIDS